MHLPAGAMVWRAADGVAAWTDAEYIAASQFDATQIGNWQRGGGEGPKPKPLPRPGDTIRERMRADSIAAKAARFQARQRARETAEEGS